MSKGVPHISIDFDGVLHADRYSDWKMPPDGKPVDGALDFVHWLMENELGVSVYTARDLTFPGVARGIRDWLERNHFPLMTVTNLKPLACLFIDDRGYRFEGSFEPIKAFMQQYEGLRPGTWMEDQGLSMKPPEFRSED